MKKEKNLTIKNITPVAGFVATSTVLGPSIPFICLWVESVMALSDNKKLNKFNLIK